MKVKLLKKLRKRFGIFTDIDSDGNTVYSVKDTNLFDNFFTFGTYKTFKEAIRDRNEIILIVARRHFKHKRLI